MSITFLCIHRPHKKVVSFPLKLLTLHAYNQTTPFLIIHTSYPDESGYQGRRQSILFAGKDFISFQISSRCFLSATLSPLSPSLGAYHTVGKTQFNTISQRR